jgi:hypothetical protein
VSISEIPSPFSILERVSSVMSDYIQHLSDHESEEDPSDSEWEMDTGLTQRVSNRTQ